MSLAGALVSIETMHELGGADDWFTTFAESEDFCRRVCLSGRRVVVVPQARIAHRRARFEGVRTKGGEPMDEDRPIDSSMARIRGRMRYSYTDTRLMMWPFVWVFGVFAAIGKTIAKLFAKRPYEALCELVAPWTLWGGLPRAIAARRRVSRQESVPIGRLAGQGPLAPACDSALAARGGDGLGMLRRRGGDARHHIACRSVGSVPVLRFAAADRRGLRSAVASRHHVVGVR